MQTEDLPAIVERGNRNESLRAVRDLLALRLTEAPPTAVAPIARILVDTIMMATELPSAPTGDPTPEPEVEESRSDELARRRADRLANS
jgi:hypothetical protein